MPNHSGIPHPDTLRFVQNAISGHSHVTSFEWESQYLFQIDRIFGDTLRVFVTDIYTVGEADIIRILAEHLDIDCIVTASTYNGYTSDACTLAKRRGVFVSNTSGLMSAIRHQDFTNPPPKRRRT